VYHLHSADILRVEQPLLADIKHLAAVAVSVINVTAAFERQCNGFLAKDVLAGRKCVYSHSLVLVQRRYNKNSLYVFVFQQFTVVVVSLGFREKSRRLLEMRVVIVAQSDDLGSRNVQQVVEMIHPPRACSDDAEPHFLARHGSCSLFGACLKPRERSHHAAQTERLDEIASVNA